jgi:hypothetical protein
MIVVQHARPMNEIEMLESTSEPFEIAITPDESECALNIAGVYQDTVTRNWAAQTCRRATQLAGEQRVQNNWYEVESLSDPAILLEAVRAALVADVIVVSVYAADKLPLDLYVWVAAWLPRRLSRAGALAALVGVGEPLDAPSLRTMEYLQAVARKAQLDFIPQEHKRPSAPSAPPIEIIAKPAGAAAQLLLEYYIHGNDAYDHWGLND